MDLELPAEVPIASLLPALVKLCVNEEQANAGSWSLWVSEMRIALNPSRTLLDARIVDGTTLALESKSAVRLAPKQFASPFQPKTVRPGAGSGGIGVKWNLPAQEL
jgi:hypothetical protein